MRPDRVQAAGGQHLQFPEGNHGCVERQPPLLAQHCLVLLPLLASPTS